MSMSMCLKKKHVTTFSMLRYWDINYKIVTILFYLLIIQLTL